jgi:hypothetical protein
MSNACYFSPSLNKFEFSPKILVIVDFREYPIIGSRDGKTDIRTDGHKITDMAKPLGAFSNVAARLKSTYVLVCSSRWGDGFLLRNSGRNAHTALENFVF